MAVTTRLCRLCKLTREKGKWGGVGWGWRGSVLTRRVTSKPTGERPARGNEAAGWARRYTLVKERMLCVCARVLGGPAPV